MDAPSQGRKKATALGYDSEQDHAPRVLAQGSGFVAERILQIAREHGIPIHEDSDLVGILASLDLYQEIPPQAYQAVAEILAFLYRIGRARSNIIGK